MSEATVRDQDATATIYVLPTNVILVAFREALAVRGARARAWRRIAMPVFTPYRPRRICGFTITADNLLRYTEDSFTGGYYRMTLPTCQRRLWDSARDISAATSEWVGSVVSKASRILVALFSARRARWLKLWRASIMRKTSSRSGNNSSVDGSTP